MQTEMVCITCNGTGRRYVWSDEHGQRRYAGLCLSCAGVGRLPLKVPCGAPGHKCECKEEKKSV